MKHLCTVGQAEPLGQGSIFSLEGLNFIYHNDEVSTLTKFYPEVTTDGIRHGIVLSQDCDLAHKKLPYITIGFLEPLSRFVRKDKIWARGALPWLLDKEGNVSITLVSPEYLVLLLNQKFTNLLKNEEPYHFFVWFDQEPDLKYRYCVVNLTKAVPIRIEHYQAIRDKVTCRLDTQFARKLGWKIAALYGRVGAEDFDKETAQQILGDMRDLLNDSLADSYPEHVRINNDEFKRAEKLKESAWPERKKFTDLLQERYGNLPNAVQAVPPNAANVELGVATVGVLESSSQPAPSSPPDLRNDL